MPWLKDVELEGGKVQRNERRRDTQTGRKDGPVISVLALGLGSISYMALAMSLSLCVSHLPCTV